MYDKKVAIAALLAGCNAKEDCRQAASSKRNHHFLMYDKKVAIAALLAGCNAKED
jgi:predicted nucleic acid-binding protein